MSWREQNRSDDRSRQARKAARLPPSEDNPTAKVSKSSGQFLMWVIISYCVILTIGLAALLMQILKDQSRLAALSGPTAIALDTYVVQGPPVNCATYSIVGGNWDDPKLTSDARCPGDTQVVGGGCSFTCLGTFVHTLSAPTQNNSWVCKMIGNDQNRTYHAYAVCAKPILHHIN
jgi:hypothetical protein